MNREQMIGLLRHLLPFLGGVATAMGWMSEEGWTVLSEQLLQMAGPIITIAGLVWSYLDKTDKAIVEKAIAIPEVSKIECMHTPEGKELASSVTSKDVVVEDDVSATARPHSMSAKRVVQSYPRRN